MSGMGEFLKEMNGIILSTVNKQGTSIPSILPNLLHINFSLLKSKVFNLGENISFVFPSLTLFPFNFSQLSLYVCVCECMCNCVYVSVSECVCTSVCECICECMKTCVCMCMYVCLCVEF